MGLKPIKVSQLNNYIKRTLQSDPVLGNISVIGEISNLKYHSLGNVYFSLKDENSKINCFLPSSNRMGEDEYLREGQEVIIHGYIYLYERGGSYSINVRAIDVSGEGDLSLAFQKLKNKLEEEGLFSPAFKKPLPIFPRKIAVVTSSTGAAVRDVVKTIKMKNDVVDIIIYPVIVQGPLAASDISSAIDDINDNYNDIDLIITGRGGGSAEELWAFNEEVVARSIFRSKIPIISAVGHETDFTISDFVADYRAETPTAAAEKAVPNTFELREYLTKLETEAKRNLKMLIDKKSAALQINSPDYFTNDIQGRIAINYILVNNLMEASSKHIVGFIKDKRYTLNLMNETIDALNPKGILKRGYSVVTDDKGRIITSIESVKKDAQINIEAADGTINARVIKTRKEL